MLASSRSSSSLTMSRAERVAEGSMRMSSGASTAYENPLSGSSICMLETPRSRMTASASTPFSASWTRTTAKSPRRKRDCGGNSRRARSKYVRASGSRSIAMSRPWPARSAARSREWPPAPNVPSTTVAPGCTARCSRTSSASTATWSVLLRCNALGNKLHAPFDLFQLLPPAGAVPDLHVVPQPGDDDLAPEARVLGEGRRDDHAPLLVELGLGRPREDEPAHLASLLREWAEALHAGRDERVPVLARVHDQAPVHAARHDHPVGQRLAKLGREGEPVLVIEGVLVFSEKHETALRSSPTLAHSKPQSSTWQPPRPKETQWTPSS